MKSSIVFLLALFVTLGFTSLNAEGMKCGAGKCGSAMMSAPSTTKCGGASKADTNTTMNMKSCDCSAQKTPPKAMKCGSGKCGSK